MHPIDDETVEQVASQNSSKSQFGILDLILITSGFALAFVSNGWQPSASKPNIPIYYAINLLVTGLTLAAFLLITRVWLVGKKNLLYQPGCLFLLQKGASTMSWVLVGAIAGLFMETNNIVLSATRTFPEITFFSTLVAIELASSAILVFAMICSKLRWRVFFLGLAGVSIANAALYVHILINPDSFISIGFVFLQYLQYSAVVMQIIALVAVPVCMFLDHREKIKYSWLHWIGLGLFFVSYCAVPALYNVLARYLSPEQMYGSFN